MGPTEASGDMRTAAAGMYQIFVALTTSGFTERQALMIIAEVVAASVRDTDD